MRQEQKQQQITYYCCNGPLSGKTGKLKILESTSVIRFPGYKNGRKWRAGIVYYKIGETLNHYTQLYHLESIPLRHGQQN